MESQLSFLSYPVTSEIKLMAEIKHFVKKKKKTQRTTANIWFEVNFVFFGFTHVRYANTEEAEPPGGHPQVLAPVF